MVTETLSAFWYHFKTNVPTEPEHPVAVKVVGAPEQLVAPIATGGLGDKTVTVTTVEFLETQVIPFSVVSHVA